MIPVCSCFFLLENTTYDPAKHVQGRKCYPQQPVSALQPAVVLSLLGAAQASPGGFPQGTQNAHLHLQSLSGNTEPWAEILPREVTTEGKETSEQEQGASSLTSALGTPTLPAYRKHLWVVVA